MSDSSRTSKPANFAMLGALDPNNPTPLYYQIFHIYKQRILVGQLSEGDKLPSESMLEEALGVSRITAKRAMDELAKAGLVTRKRGRGTIVSHARTPASVTADISGLVQNLVAIGESTTVDVLSFEYVPPPPQVANDLGLAESDLVQKVERRRSKDDQPFSYIITHVPEDIGRSYGAEDLSNQPILSLIEAAGHPIAEADQTVSALDAPPPIAMILGVPENAALLRVVRVVRDSNRRPVQHIEVFYRPDVFSLSMRLSRVGTDDASKIWAPTNDDPMD